MSKPSVNFLLDNVKNQQQVKNVLPVLSIMTSILLQPTINLGFIKNVEFVPMKFEETNDAIRMIDFKIITDNSPYGEATFSGRYYPAYTRKLPFDGTDVPANGINNLVINNEPAKNGPTHFSVQSPEEAAQAMLKFFSKKLENKIETIKEMLKDTETVHKQISKKTKPTKA